MALSPRQTATESTLSRLQRRRRNLPVGPTQHPKSRQRAAEPLTGRRPLRSRNTGLVIYVPVTKHQPVQADPFKYGQTGSSTAPSTSDAATAVSCQGTRSGADALGRVGPAETQARRARVGRRNGRPSPWGGEPRPNRLSPPCRPLATLSCRLRGVGRTQRCQGCSLGEEDGQVFGDHPSYQRGSYAAQRCLHSKGYLDASSPSPSIPPGAVAAPA